MKQGNPFLLSLLGSLLSLFHFLLRLGTINQISSLLQCQINIFQWNCSSPKAIFECQRIVNNHLHKILQIASSIFVDLRWNSLASSTACQSSKRWFCNPFETVLEHLFVSFGSRLKGERKKEKWHLIKDDQKMNNKKHSTASTLQADPWFWWLICFWFFWMSFRILVEVVNRPQSSAQHSKQTGREGGKKKTKQPNTRCNRNKLEEEGEVKEENVNLWGASWCFSFCFPLAACWGLGGNHWIRKRVCGCVGAKMETEIKKEKQS